MMDAAAHNGPPVSTPPIDRQKGSWFRRELPVYAGLALLTCLVAGRDISNGGLSWSDAPLHAMDGVFLHDLALERPSGSLRQWAEQYYLRYPCLGLIVYYPPLFAALEAGVFLVAGISVLTARLTVVLFAIGAVWLLFTLGRRLGGAGIGAAAAVLAIASPAGVAWSREVMLEWPATFFILLAVLAYLRYRERPGWLRGIAMGLACLAAFLTKQTAGFVLPLIGLHILAWPVRRPRLAGTWALPLLLAATGIAGYSVLAARYNALAGNLLWGDPPLMHWLRLETWTWYLVRLPEIFGRPALLAGLFAAGAWFGLIVRRAASPAVPSQGLALIVLWLAGWWLFSSAIQAHEERYFFFAVPPLALLAATGLQRLDSAVSLRLRPGSLVLLLACLVQFAAGVMTPASRVPAMKPTVEYLAQQPDADLVLIDSVRDGSFVFDLRTTPQARNIIPLRASKFVYSRAARTRYHYQAHLTSPEEVYAWLHQYGVRYLVLEDRLPATSDTSWDPLPRQMLRVLVTISPRFQRVFEQDLAGDDPAWSNVKLCTYCYLDAAPRQAATLRIPIPALGTQVELDLPPER